MSTIAIPISENMEERQESLTERMARGRLSMPETLRYAIGIAGCLRDLHRQGLAYGAVSAQSILLSPSDAALRNSGGLTGLGDASQDVTAFGALLEEMLRAADGPDDLRQEVDALAMRCQEEAPEMRYVLIVLRLLGLQARLMASQARMPALPPPPQALPTPKAERVRLRVRFSLHWRPLANLAAFALSNK